jgi:hypothetical protein
MLLRDFGNCRILLMSMCVYYFRFSHHSRRVISKYIYMNSIILHSDDIAMWCASQGFPSKQLEQNVMKFDEHSYKHYVI